LIAHALGIDIGTSGARAAVLAADGNIVAAASTSFASRGEDPTAPQTWEHAAFACLSSLRADCDLSSVAAVAVDGTSGTMLAVDREGVPIGSALMYDEPCQDESILARIAAGAPADSAAIGRTSALARVLMLQDRPNVRHVIHQADWLAGRLSGRFDCSDENNALKTGYDPRTRRWPEWIGRTGADLAKLPRVLEPGAPIGAVNEVARGLGLPAAAIIHAGTTDGCASFIATGASDIGEAVTALGSTLVIKMLSDRPIFASAYGIYSHRLGERWLVGGASNTGGKVIQQLFPFADLSELTARMNPQTPTGLHYYPLTRPGERFPINDPQLAPQLTPRPSDEAIFFQGVLEGIAEVEALGYRRLGELGAPALKSVRSVGGGAGNVPWSRIRQRLLGAPFETALSQEACVGTARLALGKSRRIA
jgi:D-ribulokinase